MENKTEGGPACEAMHALDPFDEVNRFESHRLTSVTEPCVQCLLKAPGVMSVIIVEVVSGFVIASSDPLSSAARRYAAHVPALIRRARMLSDDDEESVQLLMSTRKHEILVMADHKHASGAALLVIQDLLSSLRAQDGVRHASFDDDLSLPKMTARGGPL